VATRGPAGDTDQAAAVPYRRTEAGVEVCLIRAFDSANWGIPKGMIEQGDLADETALKETLEEAGLTGRLVGDPVGSYEYAKWETTLSVEVYLMEVEDELQAWDEAHFRERRWFPLREALSTLVRHPGRSVIERAAGLLERLPG
jgi:8-oxo-dGTP pyrophosphatase MutT (NUDIX family)